MGNRKNYLIKNIVEVCQKLDQKGFGANHDGNVSARFENFLLATPTAEAKGCITEEMIITLDLEGKKVEGIGNPFSEIKLHLAAYRARSNANAVVHAHPPFAMARGLTGKELIMNIPEAIVSLNEKIPVAPYAMPGDSENDSIIAKALSICDVFMIAGNGVLAIGEDLEQAYLRVELLEHLCKIDYYANGMGVPMTLPNSDRQKLVKKHDSVFGSREAAGGSKAANVAASSSHSDLKSLIAEEVKKALMGD